MGRIYAFFKNLVAGDEVSKTPGAMKVVDSELHFDSGEFELSKIPANTRIVLQEGAAVKIDGTTIRVTKGGASVGPHTTEV